MRHCGRLGLGVLACEMAVTFNLRGLPGGVFMKMPRERRVLGLWEQALDLAHRGRLPAVFPSTPRNACKVFNKYSDSSSRSPKLPFSFNTRLWQCSPHRERREMNTPPRDAMCGTEMCSN